MPALRVLETSLYVDDLDTAERFYTHVLQLTVYSRVAGRHVFFRCGQSMLLLFRPEATSLPGESVPHGCRGAGHVAFAATAAELVEWRERLNAAGVAIEHEMQWPSGGKSIYFRDPGGNSLELAEASIWGISSV